MGRHAGSNFPTIIKSIDPQDKPQVTIDNTKQPYPLQITNHINQDGEVRNFIVTGQKHHLEEYKQRINSAGRGVKPYPVNNGEAYAFPLNLRQIVESSLYDLAGTSPFYLATIKDNGATYYAIEGMVEHPDFKKRVIEIEQQLDGKMSGGKTLIHESRLTDLISNLKILRINAISNGSSRNTEDANPSAIVGANSELTVRNKEEQNKVNRKISFGEWQQKRFGGDLYQMLDFLNSDIANYASQAQIDWDATKANIVFGYGAKNEIIKGRQVHPLSPSHRGSVAISAVKKEKFGSDGKESIQYFTIRFWNKKVLKDDTIAFEAYPLLKEAYDRDVHQGFNQDISREALEKIKRDSEERERRAQLIAEQNRDKANRSIDFWSKRLPTLSDATPDNLYLKSKGIEDRIEIMDLKQDIHKSRGRYLIYPLNDVNGNFVGAQRIFDTPFSNNGEKWSNKDFILGTLFDDANGVPLGTHSLICLLYTSDAADE